MSKNIIWEYVSPIINSGPLYQGIMIPISQNNNSWANSTFRATKYSVNYPAFNNVNLSPGQPLEINPLPSQLACNIINSREIIKSPSFESKEIIKINSHLTPKFSRNDLNLDLKNV